MVNSFAITGGVEILQVIEAVAREKGLAKDAVMDSMLAALETSARKKYGHEQRIRANIDAKTGEISLFREREVVENAQELGLEIDLSDAQEKNAEAELGDIVSEPLPPIDFGRVTSQTFKQVIMQKIRDAERDKQYEEYKDRVGEIITGVVKRVEHGNVIIELGKTETILLRDQTIPREMYRTGDRIRAYIFDVRRELKGPQIFLSRTEPAFLAELFRQEVPEIYENLVQLKGVARDPGSRAKVAVYAQDSAIDPVGACIGPRGARVTAIYNELQGEKIDIIEWSADLATFAVNALASKSKDMTVEVLRIVIDEDKRLIEAIVPDEHLSLAIGRRGQNVRLAADLLGWSIDVMSDSQDSEKRTAEFNRISEFFTKVLNVDEIIGQLLASEGFTSLEEVAYVPVDDMLTIEGFDEDLVGELQKRAEEAMEELRRNSEEAWKKLGVDEALLEFEEIDNDMMIALGKGDVKNLEDLADLSRDEFKDITPDTELSDDDIDALIMSARRKSGWFDDDGDASQEEVA